MLAHFLYQINQDKPIDNGWKTGKPCKLAYVGKEISLDNRHISKFKHPYPEKSSEEVKMIQDALGMPSLRSPDIPPNHETGNTYKPYVYIDGGVEVNGSNLKAYIGKNQKSTYENGKIIPFKGDFKCKIVRDGYVANGIVVGAEYVKHGIFHKSTQNDNNGRTQIVGVISEKIINDICSYVFALCKKNLEGLFNSREGDSDELNKSTTKKKVKTQTEFRLLILPDSIINFRVMYDKTSGDPIGTDSFNNKYSEIPQSIHKSATYATIDDTAYMLNPTSTSKAHETIRYWGSHPIIGDKTFKRIGIDLERDFYPLAGFKWYFGNHYMRFARERHAQDDGTGEIGRYKGTFSNGIWHQLYEGMKQASTHGSGSEMVVICAKKLSIARIEIVMSESVTVASLKKSLLVNGVSLDDSEFQIDNTYCVMEDVLLNLDKPPDWSMYMEAVVDILGGRKMARERLVRHITANFRERYTKYDWKLVKARKSASLFLRKARFAVAALASPHDNNVEMDSAEEYAYRMGKLVGTYAKFTNVNNIAELGLHPGTRCDGHMLRRVFDDVATKLSLSQRRKDLDSVILDVKRHMPNKEIEFKDITRDLTLYFYMGLFREL